MNSAAALPDGHVMFLRWNTDDLVSSPELWEVNTDSATGALRGEARKFGGK
jgi:hypothetical protein